MNRRSWLQAGLGALSPFLGARAAASAAEVIDTHVHFYDPSRPQGVPWPPKDDALLYRRVLPADFRHLTAALGVTGVVEVEASPWPADNDWVLELAKADPLILGTVGDLEPEKPTFARELERLRHNPRFRGIRYGNLWNRDLGGQLSNPEFLAGIRRLAAAGLVLDTANPNPKLLADVLRLNDKAPGLRVIVDHLPIDPPESSAARGALATTMRELAARKTVFIKISNVARRVNGSVPENLDFYRPGLDELWSLFGEDRLLYGSNWPVSDKVAPYPTLLKLVRGYFGEKGPEAERKYFSGNARRVYGLAAG